MPTKPFAFRLNNAPSAEAGQASPEVLEALSAIRSTLQEQFNQLGRDGNYLARQFDAAAEKLYPGITNQLADKQQSQGEQPEVVEPSFNQMSLARQLRHLHSGGKINDQQYRTHSQALDRGGKANTATVKTFIKHMSNVPAGTFREENSAFVGRVAKFALGDKPARAVDREAHEIAKWALSAAGDADTNVAAWAMGGKK